MQAVLEMAKRYNIKAGIIFSVLIAVLSAFPKLIRLDFDEFSDFLRNSGYVFINVILSWFVSHYFLLQKFRLPLLKKIAVRAALSIVSGIILIMLITNSFTIFNSILFGSNSRPNMTVGQVFSIRLFRGFIITSFTFFVVYYFRMMVTLQRSRLENEYLQKENLKAQLASLREQISPHFLFNSLNTLSTLSHEHTVKEYILKMSEVYRYVLHYQDKNEVSVKDELEFIQSYIYILETRFEESVRINVDVGADKMNRKILPLALQLLLENAVKHNSVSYQRPLEISIYDNEDKLVVENDYRPKTTMEKYSGTGLTNLAQRYKLTGDQKVNVVLEKLKFKVEIPFLL